LSSDSGPIDRSARVLTIVILALAIVAIPLPWGGVLPGGRLLIQTLAFLSLATSAAITPRRPLGRALYAVVPLVAIGALGAVQLLPLSPTLLTRVSPASAEIHAKANEVLALFGRGSVAPRISIAPTETLQATLFVLACAALFYAAAAISTRRTRRRLGWLLLTASAAHIAWAVSTQRETERIHGAFVNPNHLAGYLQIALAVAFAFVVESILTGGDREARRADPLDRLHRRWTPVAWRALAWGVIVIGILVTRSRGGIAAAAVASIAMLVVALSSRHVRRHRAFAAAGSGAIALGVAIALATTGRWPLLRFFTTDPRDAESDLRVTLWRLSIDAWRDFPLLGSGLGTFREAFRRIQPDGMNLLVEQAHDDALQMLVTGGVVGLALAAASICAIAFLLWRGAISDAHREGSAWSLAALGAIVALCLHGLVEFNFSIPAIPATLAIVTGLAWGAQAGDTAGQRS
jgi:O-antigen ligase